VAWVRGGNRRNPRSPRRGELGGDGVRRVRPAAGGAKAIIRRLRGLAPVARPLVAKPDGPPSRLRLGTAMAVAVGDLATCGGGNDEIATGRQRPPLAMTAGGDPVGQGAFLVASGDLQPSHLYPKLHRARMARPRGCDEPIR